MGISLDPLPLRTPRLTLVPLDVSYADRVWTAIEASLPELRPWLVWTRGTGRDNVGEYLATVPVSWNDGSAFTFGILDGDDLVGSCSLTIHNPNLTQGEIGYWLRSDRAGRGYTTEAARAVRDFAFDVTGRHRLNLRAGVGNVGSQRVAEKIGFLREGMMRAGGSGATEHYDCYLYGMLASDLRP